MQNKLDETCVWKVIGVCKEECICEDYISKTSEKGENLYKGYGQYIDSLSEPWAFEFALRNDFIGGRITKVELYKRAKEIHKSVSNELKVIKSIIEEMELDEEIKD